MLVIRLQRVGKKNQASFRVVLQEKTWSPKGKAKELLGFYNPVTKEKAFQKDRINYWISKGAQPSPTVHNMFVDEGVVAGSKVKAWQPKKKDKPEEKPPAAAEGEKPVEGAATEEPAEARAQGDAKKEEVNEKDTKEEAKEVAEDETEETKEKVNVAEEQKEEPSAESAVEEKTE